jgi:carboxyl-terminal processing protease
VHGETALSGDLGKAPMEEDSVSVRAKDRLSIVAANNDVRCNTGDPKAGKSGHSPDNARRHDATTNNRGQTPVSIIRPATWNSANWSLTPLIFIVLAGCSVLDPYNMIGRQMGEATGPATMVVPPPPSSTLGQAARERAFDFVWETIEDRYHDRSFNGADWRAVGKRYRPLALAAPNDDRFWDVLDKMAGELRDAHTRVESPKRVELRNRDESITLGFSFIPVEGKLAVSYVHPESDAWWAGVRPGMTLAMIAGEPAAQAYERLRSDTRLDSTDRSRHLKAMRRLMTGDLGSTVAFTFERADGTRFDAALSRRKVSTRPAALHRVLPSGYGYLRFTEWTIGMTSRALEGLAELKGTPGLVIDLRNNPGGSAHAVNLILGKFFRHRTEMGHVTTRTGTPVSLFFGALEIIKLKRVVDGDPDAYAGPVVILVNMGSASASELFSGTMQAAGRAAVVGQPSCGCLLGYLGYARIPGGAELAYSEVGFVLANGKRIEGEGVIPDRQVPLTLADLRVNRDRALEEAQALLATMKPPAS